MTQPSAGSREPKADHAVLVIGVGNPDRRDDGAGVAVVRRLRGCVGPDVRLVEMPNVSRLLDGWDGADTVVIVDAMSSGARPGTVRRFDVTTTPLPARALHRGSTHGPGLAATIELARTLGRLPRRLVVIGIEGRDYRDGRGLTAKVDAAVGKVVEKMAERGVA